MSRASRSVLNRFIFPCTILWSGSEGSSGFSLCMNIITCIMPGPVFTSVELPGTMPGTEMLAWQVADVAA